jgi:tagatose-1,6-bisphosphate aldolase non-catalytic subunit AgaZ/GatZ
MPGEGMSQPESVSKEIEQIEELMRSNPDAYWKDQKKQDRYNQLLQAREKLAERTTG